MPLRKQLKAEANFMRTLVGINLSSAMEYRTSFLTQIVFMFINNGIYFVFWLIFFDRFGTIRGYNVNDIYLLFAVVAFSFGIGNMFAGNTASELAYLIAQGRLDYYLALPRCLLSHVVFSRMKVSTIGDVSFGLMAFIFTGMFSIKAFALFLAVSLAAATIYIAFATVAGSLAFFMGNAQYASQQFANAVLTFALYPNTLFSGGTRMLLYTLVPAAFLGSVPVEILRSGNLLKLAGLWTVALVSVLIAAAVFYTGLRRYESGSAININV